ncbi:MAG: hypothetical protein EP329_08845 [Deltaproteobacteria bacterium]|nr:MAG: hypothetical protein EP329_08845 [Deltaproteobacteria bacterium]
MKLTPTQRHALLLAFSNEHGLYGYFTSARTLEALRDEGLIAPANPDRVPDPDEDEDEGEYVITQRGREVLGAWVPPSRRPKRLITALRMAATALIGDHVQVVTRRKASLPSFTDDGPLDLSDVYAVAEAPRLDPDNDKAEVRWSAVATMASEMGFPCSCELAVGHVLFYKDE